MADRTARYHVKVTTDVAEARQQLNQVVEQLNRIGTTTDTQVTASLKSAGEAARELAANFQGAINQNTGKLDLIAFNQNLKRTNQDLQSGGEILQRYGQRLSQLGTSGQQAFYDVTKAIATAEQPLKRTNQLMDSLWITMKNTMRWQLTTTVLQGFVGQLETAYGYAQDLNESLNRIQIVTQNSTEQMAKFAKQANQAAKELSTTTTRYADASLIYYQQGLGDAEVEARTNATIKYANVAGITAQAASEQLTAIWNNFAKGAENLEYYVDVMTKLGATTASSSSEISEGLKKFAAVSNTVGLSYEYAASALATLTAKTRESADTVGNALNTLFARIQGLKLGDTLDDGVTLNKYSSALAVVGVSIMDANGNLRNMDDILDDLGDKWGNISTAQQVALAQTVAGVRQYRQLIALMDNWDFFKENLNTAYGATGSLQEQADIYAKSWEAASTRVRAAAESIYGALINDQFYIDLDNQITPVLDGIGDFVEGIGGMQGVLSIVASLMLNIFGDKMSSALKDMVENIGIETGYYEKQISVLRQVGIQEMQNFTAGSQYEQNILKLRTQDLQLQDRIQQMSKGMTSSQRELLDIYTQQVNALRNQAEEYNKIAEATRNRAQSTSETIMDSLRNVDFNTVSTRLMGTINQAAGSGSLTARTHQELADIVLYSQDAATAVASLGNELSSLIEKRNGLDTLVRTMNQLQGSTEWSKGKLTSLADTLGLGNDAEISRIINSHNSLANIMQRLTNLVGQYRNGIQQSRHAMVEFGATESLVRRLADQLNAAATNEARVQILTQGLTEILQNNSDALRKNILNQVEWTTVIISTAQSLASMAMTANMVSNVVTTLGDDTQSSGQKVISTLTSIGFILPGVIKQVSELVATWGTMSMIAPSIGVALTVVGIALGALTAITEEQAKAAAKLRQEAYDQAKASEELTTSNRQLINSMSELLDTYGRTGEGKSDLDNVTKSLADAYNLEGSALASLTGKYEDYNKVLQNALDRQNEQLKNQLRDTKEAQNAAASEIGSAAKKGRGQEIGGEYSLKLLGWGGHESDALDILSQNVSVGTQRANTYSVGSNFTISDIDFNNTKDMIALYDQLVAAKKQMEDEMSQTDLLNSGVYAATVKWIDKMQESVERYKEYDKTIAEINARLGSLPTQTMKDTDVKSLEDYTKYVQQLKDALKAEGFEDESDNIIQRIIDTSVNADLSGFQKLYDAIQEIKSLVSSDSGIDDSFLETLFTSESYDASILASLNWATITKDNFQNAYDSAVIYQQALDDVTIATSNLASAQQALKDLGKGELNAETLQNLADAFDWGNAEQNIISFEEFLNKTTWEQQQYLNQLITQSYQGIIDSSVKVMDNARKAIEDNQATIDRIGTEQRQEADQIIEAWQIAKNAWNDYQKSLETGDEFDASKYQVDWSKIGFTNFDDFKDKVGDDIEEAVAEGTEDAKIIISEVEVAESAKAQAQRDLESAEYTIEITARLNLDNQIEQIKNSVSGLTTVFNEIANGIQITTNSIGENVWAVSASCAEAIDAIYPGFIANAELLENGTFALTDSMYQAFFNSENSQLAADADTKSSMLDNGIALLEAKKTQAEEALKIAHGLSTGELTLDSLTEEQKEQLLDQYKTAQALMNGDLLADEVNTLTQSDTNWSNLWTSVSDYSAQGAENMALNVQDGTKSVVENMEQIRKAAYEAGLQVSLIGKDGFYDVKFDAAVAQWTGGNNNTINTNNTEDFFSSLKAAVEDTDLYERRKAENGGVGGTDVLSQAVGDALSQIYNQELKGINDTIAAFKLAKSKLLSGINNAKSALDDFNKENKPGKDPKQEKLLGALDETKEKYHEINEELEYYDYLIKKADEEIATANTAEEKIEAQRKKVELLTQKYEKLKDRQKEALSYVDSGQKNLQTLFGDVFAEGGLSLKFDGTTLEDLNNGQSLNLTNFEELEEYLIKKANEARAARDEWVAETYNTADAVKQEALQDTLDNYDTYAKAAEEMLKQFRELVKDYEKDVDYTRLTEGAKELKSAQDDLEKSTKAAVQEQVKELKKLEERYHEITREIERQEAALKDLSDAIGRTFGTKRLGQYQQKLKELEKQIGNIEKKFQEANQYASSDLQAIVNAGIPVQVDPETGEILNYTSLVHGGLRSDYDSKYAEYKAFMDKYNGLTYEAQKTDKINGDTGPTYKERKEELEKELDVLWKQVEANKALLDQYEDSLDMIQKMRDEWEDLQREIEDTKLNEIKYKLDIVLQVHDMKKAANEFSKAIAESFGDYLTHGEKAMKWSAETAKSEAALYENYLQQYNELREYVANANQFTDVEGAKAQMQELQQKLIASGESLLDFIDEVENMVTKAVEAASARFKEFTDQLEHNAAIASAVKELYELQGVTYKTQEGFNRLQNSIKEQYDAKVAEGRAQKTYLERNRELLAKAEAELAKQTEGTVAYDKAKKDRDALLKEFNATQEALLKNAADAMKLAQDMYIMAAEKAAYDLDQKLSNGLGLDLMQDKFNHYIETEGRYLDTVNELYAVNTYNNKIQKALDEAATKNQKDRLKALQEEMDLRRQGGKLSKYDLDMMEAKYKLVMATNALEDVQNTKNSMKLVRDSSGNWNYQYVADESQVANAQQEVWDAQNQLYNLAKDKVQQTTGDIIQSYIDMKNALLQVNTDMTLSEEERARRVEEITQYYTQRVRDLEEEKSVAIQDFNEAELASVLYASATGTGAIIDDYGNALPAIITFGKEGAEALERMKQDTVGDDGTIPTMTQAVVSLLEKMGLDADEIYNGIELDSSGHIIGMSDKIKETLAQLGVDADGILRNDVGTSIVDAFNEINEDTLAGAKANTSNIIDAYLGLKNGDENHDSVVDIFKDLVDNQLHPINERMGQDFIDTIGDITGDDGTGMIGAMAKFEDAVDDYINDMENNWDDYQQKVGDVADATGTNLEDLDDILQQVSDDTENLDDKGQDLANTLWDQVGAIYDVSQAYLELAESIQQVIDKMEELAHKMALDVGDWANGIGVGDNILEIPGGTFDLGNIIPNGPNGYNATAHYDELIQQGLINGWLQLGSDQYNNLFSQRENKIDANGYDKNHYLYRGNEAQKHFQDVASTGQYTQWANPTNNQDAWLEELRKLGVTFASGGYTGEFDNAKLAFLHEKELVLNKDDTENILAAVSAVRSLGPQLLASIEQALDNQALGAMASLAGTLSAVLKQPSATGVVEQDVKIEAVFPNVTSSGEIEDALNSLVNDAAQYSRRRTE